MTQPRRPDEVALFYAMQREGNPYVRKLVKELGINEKRAAYICGKWTDKGWYDYGVNVFAGWLTAEAPIKLTETEIIFAKETSDAEVS